MTPISENDRRAILANSQSRKEIFFQLFPEMCVSGVLNAEGLCQELGVSLAATSSSAARSEQIHEIRNVAAIIQSGMAILQRQLRSDQNASTIIQTVMESVENLTRLVKQPN